MSAWPPDQPYFNSVAGGKVLVGFTAAPSGNFLTFIQTDAPSQLNLSFRNFLPYYHPGTGSYAPQVAMPRTQPEFIWQTALQASGAVVHGPAVMGSRQHITTAYATGVASELTITVEAPTSGTEGRALLTPVVIMPVNVYGPVVDPPIVYVNAVPVVQQPPVQVTGLNYFPQPDSSITAAGVVSVTLASFTPFSDTSLNAGWTTAVVGVDAVFTSSIPMQTWTVYFGPMSNSMQARSNIYVESSSVELLLLSGYVNGNPWRVDAEYLINLSTQGSVATNSAIVLSCAAGLTSLTFPMMQNIGIQAIVASNPMTTAAIIVSPCQTQESNSPPIDFSGPKFYPQSLTATNASEMQVTGSGWRTPVVINPGSINGWAIQQAGSPMVFSSSIPMQTWTIYFTADYLSQGSVTFQVASPRATYMASWTNYYMIQNGGGDIPVVSTGENGVELTGNDLPAMFTIFCAAGLSSLTVTTMVGILVQAISATDPAAGFGTATLQDQSDIPAPVVLSGPNYFPPAASAMSTISATGISMGGMETYWTTVPHDTVGGAGIASGSAAAVFTSAVPMQTWTIYMGTANDYTLAGSAVFSVASYETLVFNTLLATPDSGIWSMVAAADGTSTVTYAPTGGIADVLAITISSPAGLTTLTFTSLQNLAVQAITTSGPVSESSPPTVTLLDQSDIPVPVVLSGPNYFPQADSAMPTILATGTMAVSMATYWWTDPDVYSTFNGTGIASGSAAAVFTSTLPMQTWTIYMGPSESYTVGGSAVFSVASYGTLVFDAPLSTPDSGIWSLVTAADGTSTVTYAPTGGTEDTLGIMISYPAGLTSLTFTSMQNLAVQAITTSDPVSQNPGNASPALPAYTAVLDSSGLEWFTTAQSNTVNLDGQAKLVLTMVSTDPFAPEYMVQTPCFQSVTPPLPEVRFFLGNLNGAAKFASFIADTTLGLFVNGVAAFMPNADCATTYGGSADAQKTGPTDGSNVFFLQAVRDMDNMPRLALTNVKYGILNVNTAMAVSAHNDGRMSAIVGALFADPTAYSSVGQALRVDSPQWSVGSFAHANSFETSLLRTVSDTVLCVRQGTQGPMFALETGSMRFANLNMDITSSCTGLLRAWYGGVSLVRTWRPCGRLVALCGDNVGNGTTCQLPTTPTFAYTSAHPLLASEPEVFANNTRFKTVGMLLPVPVATCPTFDVRAVWPGFGLVTFAVPGDSFAVDVSVPDQSFASTVLATATCVALPDRLQNRAEPLLGGVHASRVSARGSALGFAPGTVAPGTVAPGTAVPGPAGGPKAYYPWYAIVVTALLCVLIVFFCLAIGMSFRRRRLASRGLASR